jgi:uncharacterized protein YjbJ (UPF0337 family)
LSKKRRERRWQSPLTAFAWVTPKWHQCPRWRLNIDLIQAGAACSQRSVRSIGGSKMKPSTENEVAGKVHEVKGKIKEKVGQLTNDPDLEAEGTGEKIAGKIQNKIGQVEKVLEKP